MEQAMKLPPRHKMLLVSGPTKAGRNSAILAIHHFAKRAKTAKICHTRFYAWPIEVAVAAIKKSGI